MKLHEYVYDKSGNLYQVTAHMAGKTYRLSYDLLDRLMRMTDEQGNSYTYTYDVNNCMVKMNHTCGSSSADTSYTYDKDSREVMTKCATSYTRTTTYDKFGRVNKRSWNTPAAFDTVYTYWDSGNNRYNLPKTVKNGGETLEYAYDANGNITSIKDSAVESTFQYDELNQLIRENCAWQNSHLPLRPGWKPDGSEGVCLYHCRRASGSAAKDRDRNLQRRMEGLAPVLGWHGHDLRCYWKYAD